ncbi:endo-alpha-N-acetylgalactosaminidase family protein [Paenibacillus lautus]|uniref:endo-alpha-N-acetylgalactosaminidase family protein n=1 Tax=Paenibacillus lautus TaxID=1401 RepID=UPI000FDB4E24|nr:endo-alpha-N-acetylgalactosaminidase family protein [Paenibacillus lautus]
MKKNQIKLRVKAIVTSLALVMMFTQAMPVMGTAYIGEDVEATVPKSPELQSMHLNFEAANTSVVDSTYNEDSSSIENSPNRAYGVYFERNYNDFDDSSNPDELTVTDTQSIENGKLNTIVKVNEEQIFKQAPEFLNGYLRLKLSSSSFNRFGVVVRKSNEYAIHIVHDVNGTWKASLQKNNAWVKDIPFVSYGGYVPFEGADANFLIHLDGNSIKLTINGQEIGDGITVPDEYVVAGKLGITGWGSNKNVSISKLGNYESPIEPIEPVDPAGSFERDYSLETDNDIVNDLTVSEMQKIQAGKLLTTLKVDQEQLFAEAPKIKNGYFKIKLSSSDYNRFGLVIRKDDTYATHLVHDINGTWNASLRKNGQWVQNIPFVSNGYVPAAKADAEYMVFMDETKIKLYVDGHAIGSGITVPSEYAVSGQPGITGWGGTKTVGISNVKFVEGSTNLTVKIGDWVIEDGSVLELKPESELQLTASIEDDANKAITWDIPASDAFTIEQAGNDIIMKVKADAENGSTLKLTAKMVEDFNIQSTFIFKVNTDVIVQETIVSDKMQVTVNQNFPSIAKYVWLDGDKTLFGQEDVINEVMLNGKSYTPNVEFTKKGNDTASYRLTFDEIKVAMDMEIKVVDNIVTFKITNIEDPDKAVFNIQIPNHNLLSVKSTQAGATFAGSRMHTARTGTGDTIVSVEGTPSIDASAKNYMYAFVNTHELSGGVWTNAIVDQSADSDRDNDRLKKQTVTKFGYYQTGIWSTGWTYRIKDFDETEDLPEVKIAISPDANGDGIVDWQDGAIVYRDIMNNPLGVELIPEMVVQRMPTNFASQTAQPFLRTLDETKRVYLATDGLEQHVLVKGYQSEGHDSAHPDYGGNIGKRMGGAQDLNTLVNVGSKYNANFSVHINAQESYPEAKNFSEELVYQNQVGWDWLEESYIINKRLNGTNGNRLERLKQLKEEVPGLTMIYLDVWYDHGWNGRKIAREINSLGWPFSTEFMYSTEWDSIWSHWAVDHPYGGNDTKGYNSHIARFLRNHQKDIWLDRDPLLGGTELVSFEGWSEGKNFDNMIKMTFGTNLPTKFLQHYPIMKWEGNTIQFQDKVEVSTATGERVIKKDDVVLLKGKSYLLPWTIQDEEEKLYHWNETGGSTTWTLTNDWANLDSVKVYKLTDKGRELVKVVSVVDGQVTLNADVETPYVVYKGEASTVSDVDMINFGEGSYLKDPGFDRGKLDGVWTVEGSDVTVERNSFGQNELVIDTVDATATVSQTITGLTPGTYYASVYVQTTTSPSNQGRKAYIGIKDIAGMDEVSNYTDGSYWKNIAPTDSKHNTNMMKMPVYFEVPEGQTTATLYLKVDKGEGQVVFDDVRVIKVQKSENPTDAYFVQDFEHVPDGWYPFVRGNAGTGAQTHLSELNAPYTQKGWNGKQIDDVINGNWSFKSHNEAPGILYQTLPQTLRFEANKRYRLSFYYENEVEGAYSFVLGDLLTEVKTENLPAVTVPTRVSFEFDASSSGQNWIGISKTSRVAGDFVLDDLIVEEIDEDGVDTSALETAIKEAQGKVDDAKVGDQPGQYPEAAVNALHAAIAEAQGVVESATSQKEVAAAIEALQASVKAFDNAKITEVGPPVDETAPTWPANAQLIASSINNTSLTLSWPAAMDNTGVSNYKIYKNGIEYTVILGDITSYTFSGLSANTSYNFEVKAGNAAGIWSASLSVKVKTDANSSGGGSAPTPDPTSSTSDPTPSIPSTPDPTPTESTKPMEPAEPKTPKLVLSDVANHWAKASIEKSVELGFVTGYEDGTFRPNASATRAEISTMLARALKLKQVNTEFGFADKDKTPVWAQSFIQAIAKAGYITGYEDGTFRANNEITRSEIVAIIVRVLNLEIDPNASSSFKDAYLVPAWAKSYVTAAEKAGLVNGYGDGNFNPNVSITRAEAVTIILAMLSKM